MIFPQTDSYRPPAPNRLTIVPPKRGDFWWVGPAQQRRPLSATRSSSGEVADAGRAIAAASRSGLELTASSGAE